MDTNPDGLEERTALIDEVALSDGFEDDGDYDDLWMEDEE